MQYAATSTDAARGPRLDLLDELLGGVWLSRSTHHHGRVDAKRGDERTVQLEQPRGTQPPDKMSEHRLRQAHERIALHAALVTEPFIRADRDLCGETVPGGIDRRADDGRVLRRDEHLTADDQEHAEDPPDTPARRRLPR